MDCKRNGTEHHKTTSPTSKSKPPVARKPTKPIPPKKPTLATKPLHLISALSAFQPINGELESPASPQLGAQPPVQPAPRPTALSSPQLPSSRPREPPPPLPKSPPKGPALCKTPPPLPKTPPRGGSVRSHSKKLLSAQSSFDADSANSSPSPSLNDEPCSDSSKPKLSPAKSFPNTNISICDKSDTTIEKKRNTSDENTPDKSNSDNKSTVSNLKSGLSGSNEKLAPKHLPKIPLKPRPRPADRKQSLSLENDEKIDLNIHNKVNGISKCGNTTWFAAAPEEVKQVKSEVSKDETGDSEVHYKLDKQESVHFYKAKSPSQSPRQSPRLPRKPVPRTPVKPTKNFFSYDSAQDVTPVKPGTNDNTIPSSCDNDLEVNKQRVETFQGKDERANSVDNESVLSPKSTDNKTDESSSVDSPVSNPKPVPRRPAPRPRPTPRKRQSLNRLSGTEETFPGQYITGSVHNLSDDSEQTATANTLSNIKAKSEDSVFLAASQGFSLASREIDINAEREDNSRIGECAKKSEQLKGAQKERENSERGSKVTSLKKSRVVYSDKGEEKQYRIIDKSIINTHATDTDNPCPETVVLSRTGDDIDNKEKSAVTKDDTGLDIPDGNQSESSKAVLTNTSKTITNTPASALVNKAVNKKTNSVDRPEHNLKSNGSESDPKEVVGDVLRDSFEDLLSDKSILEPSSLLNEIEEILARSYKHSSLTRAESSPQKPNIQSVVERANLRCERSRSVDINTGSTPVRPPRPKREQKRLRSRSQVVYDSCGSDTESLPDLSRSREDLKSNCSLTLPPAKPHPPKPRRNKLLKVQRSQSDITAMKSVMDKQVERNKSPASSHKRQSSDAGPYMSQDGQDSEADSSNPGRQMSWRKNRPTRKAPPPPGVPPFKVTPPSPSVDINTVVPLSNTKADQKRSSTGRDKLRKMKQMGVVKDTSGSVYSCINDDDVQDSSDGDHDYHYISDDAENYETVETKPKGMVKVEPERHGKRFSPPKLPPRNMNNSHSFETSSLSSASHDFDSVITGAASSIDDLSESSGCIEPENGILGGSDIMSPGFKALKHYPKTSSPNVKHMLVPDSDSSEQSGLGVGKTSRPVSGASLLSDDGSVLDTPLSTSESDLEDEEKVRRKKDKKLYMIATEIMTSERIFVDVLYLLNVDFRKHISNATEAQGRPVIPSETLNRILDYLPQLQNFNEDLLKDLEERVTNWEEKPGIADIFVKKGPFLKLYSSYIRDFETMTCTLDEAVKKYPAFQAALKEFEMSQRCAQLALKHYMLKPIQRIPQYRMLLQDYIKHMQPDSPEMKDMQTALAIVSEVAHHANENMRHGDYVQKMLEIQRSLIGQFEVIKPGRIFLKEGELMKLSRKDMQPRYFFMFNDVLLYTTPVATGYRLNNVLPLAGMKVSVSCQDEYKTEFNIISVQRSFTVHAASIEEREDWVTALNAAIEENALKRNTFEAVRAGAQVLLDKDFVLGHKAPLWIPDARVTMCMLCTSEFTVTWRRHHCRACGRVVCGNCTEHKASLRYLKYKTARVCDECYKTLSNDGDKGEQDAKVQAAKVEDEGNLLDNITSLFERFQKIRKSGRTEKKAGGVRPDRLKEVRANDEGASMSGYLQRHKNKKWKKHWYLIKDKVLYTFKATQDTAASDSMVLLGYEVFRFTEYFEGIEPDLLFQLIHANTDPIVFRTDSATATQKWVTVMRESTVA